MQNNVHNNLRSKYPQKALLLYEGKAKQVYSTNDEDTVILHYKDDATAFNAQKKGQITNKGIMNNKITIKLFQFLAKHNIPNHFIEQIDDREQLCWKVEIIKLEVIVRNIIAGSMAKRLGIAEGTVAPITIYEICYKNDEYGDPLINDHHAVAMQLATYNELNLIYEYTKKINVLLQELFLKENIILVDFKIEFGKDRNGKIVLADEITPDTCRLWDQDTKKKLDKDRFRQDLGGVEQAYLEILTRIGDS